MKVRRTGRIVNVSSRVIHGGHERTSYSAAKSALIGCTRTWALELAEYGVTVNAVAPGPIETELFRVDQPAGSAGEKRALAPFRQAESSVGKVGVCTSASQGGT